jgi:hypothetical protein
MMCSTGTETQRMFFCFELIVCLWKGCVAGNNGLNLEHCDAS